MSANRSLLTIAVAAAVLLAGTAPAAAQTSGTASQTFTATVEVTEDATIVTVEENSSAAANVDVHVDSVDDASYGGSGAYTTDADGQVVLSHPDTETTVELAVESDGTRANGTVVLNPDPAVEAETTVTLSATAEGAVTSEANESTEKDESTETPESNESSTESDDGDDQSDRQSSGEPDDEPSESQGGFGVQISAFVGSIVDASASIGQDVSAFAQEHNPASAEDDAGANASADAGVDASANGDGGADADVGADANVSATAGADGASSDDSASTNVSAESNATVDANTTDGNASASGNVSVAGGVGSLSSLL